MGLFVFAAVCFAQLKELTQREKRLLALAIAAAAAARFLAPARLVMAFSGYSIIDQAITLTPYKYGAAGPVFYNVIFKFIQPSTEAFLRVNSAVGALTVIASAFFAGKLFKERYAALTAAVLVGLSPFFIRDHNSESNIVPAALFLLTGLTLFIHALDENNLFVAFTSVCVLVFSAMFREWFALLTPVVLLLLYWGRDCAGNSKAFRLLRITLGLYLILISAPAVYLYYFYAAGSSFDGMSPVSAIPGYLAAFFDHTRNLLFNPRLTPAIYIILILLAFFASDRRRKKAVAALFATGVLFFSVYQIDEPSVSRPRLQAPYLLFVSLIAALGCASLFTAIQKKYISALIIIFGALSFVPPALTFFEKNNEDYENEMIAAGYSLLPKNAVLIRAGLGDEGWRKGIFYSYPDYDLKIKRPDVKAETIGNYEAAKSEYEGRPKVFYLGMRCYAALKGRPFETTNGMLPACAAFMAQRKLKPLLVKEFPNRFDGEFFDYPHSESIKLGYYLTEN